MPLPVWLIPSIISAGAGVASWLGGERANKQNERMADKQMDFQERMSSTSAQRSVKDYEAAGLNPALAYDRPASSPAGALSRAEDAVGKGVSTAMQARALVQSLEIAKAQSQADLELKQSQVARNAAEGATAIVQGDVLGAQRRMTDAQIGALMANQPHDLRKKIADAAIREYEIPAYRNEAKMQNRLGELAPQLRFWLGNARTAASLMPRF